MLLLVGCTASHDVPVLPVDLPVEVPDPEPEPPPTATVALSDNDQMVLEERFAITLSRSARVFLTCTSPDDPLEDHRLELDGEAGELRLYGLLADTAYACTLTDEAETSLWEGSFTTGSLGDGFPAFEVSGDADTATIDTRYLAFSHWQIGIVNPHVHRLIVMDGQGRVRWYEYFAEAQTGGIAATWLGDRFVLGGGGVSPSLRNLSGEVLFEVAPPAEPDPEDDVYNHEAQLTPEGLLSLQKVDDADAQADWAGFRIEVTDPETAEVVWSFDSVEGRLAGALPPGTPTQRDPYHANAVTWRDDDPLGPSVWVSLREMQALMRIDRNTRELSFVGHAYGTLEDESGDPLPRTDWFWGQHAPHYDGDQILVYDNGGDRPPAGSVRYSRVAMFRRQGADRTTLLWDWREDGWFEPNFGQASPLPDGHVLVASGHCFSCPGTGGTDATGSILELDPMSGTVLWRFDFSTPNDSTYRAQAVEGCDLFANRRYCPGP